MTNEAKREELLKRLADGVLNFEEDDVVAAANEVLELGLDGIALPPRGFGNLFFQVGRG